MCPLRWCEAAERQSTARLPQGQKRLDRIAEPGIDLLDLRAQIGKILLGLLGEMGHIGIDLVDIAQTWRPRDPQAPHAVIQARQIIGRALRAGCHVVTIRLADDRERARRILDCARQRADMGQKAHGGDGIGGNTAIALLDAVNATKSRRNPDRSRPVGADMHHTEIEGGRRRPASGGTAGIAAGIPGIAGNAGEGRIADPLPAIFRHGCFAEQNGARLPQPRHHGGIGVCQSCGGDRRTAAAGPAFDIDIVFDGDA